MKSLLLRIVLMMIVILGLLAGVPIAINLNDDKPAQAVEKLMADAAQKNAEENAFNVLVGIYVKDSEEAAVRGAKEVELINTATSKRPGAILHLDEMLGKRKKKWSGKKIEWCDIRNAMSSCIENALKNARSIDRAAKKNAALLKEYNSLPSYAEFYESWNAQAKVHVNYVDLIKPLHHIAIGQMVVQLLASNPDVALSDWVKNTTFWRKVLASSRSIDMKELAISNLWLNYRFLSEAIKEGHVDRPGASIVFPLLTPLTQEERGFLPAINAAYAYYANHFLLLNERARAKGVRIATLSGPADYFLSYLYKKNSTANSFYAWMQQVEDLASANAKDFLSKRIVFQEAGDDEVNWYDIDNFMGKAFIADAKKEFYPGLERTVRATHDLDGYIHLVSLQSVIRRTGLTRANIYRYMGQLKEPKYMDPYTQRTMGWDPVKQVIYFTGYSEIFAEKNQIEIRL